MEDGVLEELGRLIPNVCRRVRETYRLCKDLPPEQTGHCKAQRELLELCYKNQGRVAPRHSAG